VNSNLGILIEQQRIRMGGRRPGIRKIAEESGASVSMVQGLLNNKMRRVPLDDLALLCKYFGCQVGDILVYIPDPE